MIPPDPVTILSVHGEHWHPEAIARLVGVLRVAQIPAAAEGLTAPHLVAQDTGEWVAAARRLITLSSDDPSAREWASAPPEARAAVPSVRLLAGASVSEASFALRGENIRPRGWGEKIDQRIVDLVAATHGNEVLMALEAYVGPELTAARRLGRHTSLPPRVFFSLRDALTGGHPWVEGEVTK